MIITKQAYLFFWCNSIKKSIKKNNFGSQFLHSLDKGLEWSENEEGEVEKSCSILQYICCRINEKICCLWKDWDICEGYIKRTKREDEDEEQWWRHWVSEWVSERVREEKSTKLWGWKTLAHFTKRGEKVIWKVVKVK